MPDRKERLRSGDLLPGDDPSLPIDIPLEMEEDDWIIMPLEPPCVEMEPILHDPVPPAELILDSDYMEFLDEIEVMLYCGTLDGAPPGIAAF